MKIDTWFPTSIYLTNIEELESVRAAFISRIYKIKETVIPTSDWRCDTYNTLNTSYDIRDDKAFEPLIIQCNKHVETVSRFYGIKDPKATMTEGWINVSSPGNYQEYHIHPNNHFSLVYYLSVNKDTGNICFKSHESYMDMYPLNVDDLNEFNYKSCSYAPKNNTLIIFRSNLQHMVEKNNSDQDRISIAMNYRIEK